MKTSTLLHNRAKTFGAVMEKYCFSGRTGVLARGELKRITGISVKPALPAITVLRNYVPFFFRTGVLARGKLKRADCQQATLLHNIAKTFGGFSRLGWKIFSDGSYYSVLHKNEEVIEALTRRDG